MSQAKKCRLNEADNHVKSSVISHTTQECVPFKEKLHELMDSKLITFYSGTGGETDICMASSQDEIPSFPNHVIHYQPSVKSSAPLQGMKPIIIRTPQPFEFKSTKVVPWNYSCQINGYENTSLRTVTNITGLSGVTRTGRHYGLAEEPIEKERARKEEINRGKRVSPDVVGPDFFKHQEGNHREEEMESLAPGVTDKEACEFLKLVKQSEFKVVEQLNRMPARISLLSLMLTSEPHRQALLKVLNQAHVCHNVSVERLDGIVGVVLTNGKITFNEDEIPPEGTEHTKALHISVKCKDFMVARVLIDNGSALNVIPKSTLNKLRIDDTFIRPSFTVVRAFDGTKRQVIGEIELPIQVGPQVFKVDFHVMDINPTYSLLLGRPWLHAAGVVPSSLHQKLKFVIDGKLIEVFRQQDLLISRAPDEPYVEAAEEAIESAFQTFEIEDVSYVGEREGNPNVQVARATLMSAKCLVKDLHYSEWQEVLREPIQLKENKNHYGLGYAPKGDDMKRIQREKKRRRMSQFGGNELYGERIIIPHITRTFRSAGRINARGEDDIRGIGVIFSGLKELSIHMVGEQDVKSMDWVRQLEPEEDLNNWVSVECPPPSIM
ncbi:hypothetical protein LINPERPRIM_LOCUS20104 [Linum perenne]